VSTGELHSVLCYIFVAIETRG